MSNLGPAGERGDAVASVRERLTDQPLSVEEADRLAASFKALADPARLRLLSMIATHQSGEACVCDLTDAFQLAGPTISHHLKVLRQAGLIVGERRGTWVHYRLVPEGLHQLSRVLMPASAVIQSG
jgi:ArsR family transcriptional regulator